MDYNFMSKNEMCTGKNEKQKVKIHKKKQAILHYSNYRNSQLLVFDKLNVAKIYRLLFRVL